MTAVPTSQLTLSLEPSLPERWSTLREFIAHRVTIQSKPAKTIAAGMDLSPSVLSRKLNPPDGDGHRFNVDDLEAYMRESGDASAIIEYLAAKYMGGGDEARKARAIAHVEALSRDLQKALLELKA